MKHRNKHKKVKTNTVKKIKLSKEEIASHKKIKIVFYAALLILFYKFISAPYISDARRVNNNFLAVSLLVQQYIKDNKENISNYKTTDSQYCDNIRKYCSVGITNIDGINEKLSPDSEKAKYHIVIKENGKNYFNFLIVTTDPHIYRKKFREDLQSDFYIRMARNIDGQTMYHSNGVGEKWSLYAKDYPNITQTDQIGYFDNINLQ